MLCIRRISRAVKTDPNSRVPSGRGMVCWFGASSRPAHDVSEHPRPTTRRAPNLIMPEPIDYKSAGVDLDTYEQTMAQLRLYCAALIPARH